MERKLSGQKLVGILLSSIFMAGVGKRNHTKRILLMVFKVGDRKPVHKAHVGLTPASAAGDGAAQSGGSRGEVPCAGLRTAVGPGDGGAAWQ